MVYIKLAVIITATLALYGCVTNTIHNADLLESEAWINNNNFKKLPKYYSESELTSKPIDAVCENEECLEFTVGEERYVYAKTITGENYKELIVGSWTGSSCVSDKWEISANGNFRSQYPTAQGIYSWAGKFYIDGNKYIEEGMDSDGKSIHNTAKLLYVPSKRYLVYRGISSLDSVDSNGLKKYKYYKGPEYFYFVPCK